MGLWMQNALAEENIDMVPAKYSYDEINRCFRAPRKPLGVDPVA